MSETFQATSGADIMRVPLESCQSFNGDDNGDSMLGLPDPVLTSAAPDVTHCPSFDDSLPSISPYSWSLDSIEEPETPLDLIYQPSMMAPPAYREPLGLESLIEAVAKRLRFGIEEIKKAPASMVYNLTTPWCHPRLWEQDMPRSMQGI